MVTILKHHRKKKINKNTVTPPGSKLRSTSASNKNNPSNDFAVSKKEILNKQIKKEKITDTEGMETEDPEVGIADFRQKLSAVKNKTGGGIVQQGNSHKLYTALLITGEAIAYVGNRYSPKKPGYVANGFMRLDNDALISEKLDITLTMKKRSVDNFDAHWTQEMNGSNGTYSLPWRFLVRCPKEEETLTLDGVAKWGTKIAKFLTFVEDQVAAENPGPSRNTYTFAGDITKKTGVLRAGDFSTTMDVMRKLVSAVMNGMQPAEACSHDFLLQGYYGPERSEAVSNYFKPPQSPTKTIQESEEPESSPNQDIYDMLDNSEE